MYPPAAKSENASDLRPIDCFRFQPIAASARLETCYLALSMPDGTNLCKTASVPDRPQTGRWGPKIAMVSGNDAGENWPGMRGWAPSSMQQTERVSLAGPLERDAQPLRTIWAQPPLPISTRIATVNDLNKPVV
jgi:hypothetical protein